MTAALLVPALACAALLIAVPGVNIALGVLAVVIAVAYIAYQFYKSNNKPEISETIYRDDRYNTMFKGKKHRTAKLAAEEPNASESLGDNTENDSDAEGDHVGHYYDIDGSDTDLGDIDIDDIDDHDISPAA